MSLVVTRLAPSVSVTVLAAALAFAGASLAREPVQPGKPAPEFTATDSAGKAVSLTALKGKTVVLEWTNHDCPYVKKHYGSGTMQKLQKDATDKGVVWLSVVSSAKGQQGYVVGLEADKLTADRKAAPTAVLLDPEGRLGRLYGASTTPHMFVIDGSGTLAYAGAIDDKPSSSRDTLATARPYVREALDALAQGKPVATSATRPYGCSVKYDEARS